MPDETSSHGGPPPFAPPPLPTPRYSAMDVSIGEKEEAFDSYQDKNNISPEYNEKDGLIVTNNVIDNAESTPPTSNNAKMTDSSGLVDYDQR